MPVGSSRSSKPKPSEVAADTKRNIIPWIRRNTGYKMYSFMYRDVYTQLEFDGMGRPYMGGPTFCEYIVHSCLVTA